MDRRRFIVSGGALCLVAGSQSQLPLTFGESVQYSLGYIDSWSRHLGPKPSYLSGLKKYPDLNSAVAALKSGEIEGLFSTPELWASHRPEILIFGSLAGLESSAGAAQWVQENYQRLNDFYSTQGLSGRFIGLGPSLHMRLSRTGYSKLQNVWERQHIRVAATGVRAIWFKKMGFNVVADPLFEKLDHQLERLWRQKIEMTDAFYPALMESAVSYNSKSLVPHDGYKGQNLIVDPVTRSSLVVDLLTLSESKLSKNSTQKILSVAQELAAEDYRQESVASGLEVSLQLQPRVQLPKILQTEILKCNRSYVHAASLTADPFGWANSLRKAIS